MTYFDEAHSLSGMAHQPIRLMPHPHTDKEPCPGGCDDIVAVEETACRMRKDIQGLESRIQDSHDQMTRFEARLGEGNDRMGRIEIALTTNAAKIDNNSAETSEILEIMKDGKSFFRFARRAGSVLTWTLGIATAIIAFWVAIKGLTK